MTANPIYVALTQHPYSNSVAAAGSMTWFWLPYVQTVSSGAALVLPILSVAWLGIQIWSHLRGKKDKK